MKQALIKCLILLLLVPLGWAVPNAFSADQESTRIRIGLKLFRTILAADMQIKEKLDDKGQIALAIIYKSDEEQAQRYGEKLRKMGKGKKRGKIKKIPISVDIIPSTELDKLSERKYAGIYLVEEVEGTSLHFLIDYGIKQQLILYSPFAGAVEQGVTAGLVIEARVKPYVNSRTLKTSQLQLKSFFMKVSKQYEP